MAFPFTLLSNQWLNGEEETQVTLNARIDQPLNALAANFALVQAPTVFIALQSGTQSLVNNTVTPITLDTEVVDVYGGHTGSSSQFVVPSVLNGMRLRYVGLVNYAANATGFRVARITQNSVLVPGANQTVVNTGTTGPGVQVVGSSIVATGDIIELNGDQNSTGALLTAANSQIEIFWGGTT